jgi:hypothetical protein
MLSNLCNALAVLLIALLAVTAARPAPQVQQQHHHRVMLAAGEPFSQTAQKYYQQSAVWRQALRKNSTVACKPKAPTLC